MKYLVLASFLMLASCKTVKEAPVAPVPFKVEHDPRTRTQEPEPSRTGVPPRIR